MFITMKKKNHCNNICVIAMFNASCCKKKLEVTDICNNKKFHCNKLQIF